ncbi:YhcN/YlaJ family sporulation lipoprotein [Cytobacillus sp. FSL W7-1323]|uniref:YhcN/YlaJ family sporulation lipoprotein n=1 Tax=Cytobacillus sp. FSL W7-1323 TaxID=2921700 RepID=UPI0031598E73
MQKKILFVPFAVVMSMSLAACGTNNDASETTDENRNRTVPMGYYTNEQHNQKSKFKLLNDDDGAVTEWMDHSLGDETDTTRDGKFSKTDVNYNGHIEYNHVPRSNYYQSYEGELIEKVIHEAEEVEQVKEARAAEHDGKIVIALRLNKDADEKQVEQEVFSKVKSFVGERKVRIVTNESQFFRLNTIDNDVKAGLPMEKINENIDEIFYSK